MKEPSLQGEREKWGGGGGQEKEKLSKFLGHLNFKTLLMTQLCPEPTCTMRLDFKDIFHIFKLALMDTKDQLRPIQNFSLFKYMSISAGQCQTESG